MVNYYKKNAIFPTLKIAFVALKESLFFILSISKKCKKERKKKKKEKRTRRFGLTQVMLEIEIGFWLCEVWALDFIMGWVMEWI